jgi:hypothetical protein
MESVVSHTLSILNLYLKIMKTFTHKIIILSTCFLAYFNAFAGDTITFVSKQITLVVWVKATPNKQITYRCTEWNIEKIFTSQENPEEYTLLHAQFPYSSNGVEKEVTIEGEEGCAFFSYGGNSTNYFVDFSKAPSIEWIGYIGNTLSPSYPGTINVRNCKNLKELYVDGRCMKEIDLIDCKSLEAIGCNVNHLSELDIYSDSTMRLIYARENHLPLSYLYYLSELVEDPNGKVFERQTLGRQRILLNGMVDYSSQKEFDGKATDFYVMRGIVTSGFDYTNAPPLAPLSDYTLENGIFTFHRAGEYTIDMRNTKITQHWQCEPARALAWIEVIDFVPVTEITNVPEKAIAGKPLFLHNSTVLPHNASYFSIKWCVVDTGTTGAFFSVSALYTTAPGTVVVRATIEDGIAFGVPYTQDFSIEVIPLSIQDPISPLSMIKVYPNPTAGELTITSCELQVTSIEIFDVLGRRVSSNSKIISSSHQTVDISFLNSGIYFVKITTEQGEIVKKIEKQ